MQYLKLVEVYDHLESSSKRLDKTFYIAKLLSVTPEGDLTHILLLLQGKLYPPWDERKIGVAARIILKALNLATGENIERVESEWKHTGDLGKVAENLILKKKQSTLFNKELSVEKVFTNLRKLSELEGEGTVNNKVQLIAELLTSASPIEAKYITRTVLEELRIGVGEGSIRDAIVWCHFNDLEKMKEIKEGDTKEEYKNYLTKVQEAYDLTNDFGEVAIASRKGESALENIQLKAGKPIKVMLGPKAKDVAEAFEIVGKPAAIEYKYDGFRMQVHNDSGKIKIFTRRLEDVTLQFPEVVTYFKKNVQHQDYIFDGEAVGFDPKTKKYLPFQKVSQRIKRKYDIEKTAKEFPVELNVFDVILLDGKNLLKIPFQERRKILEETIPQKQLDVVLAKQIISDDEKTVTQFYEDTLKLGMEGVMFKNITASYKPGSRVGHMVKLKPVMEGLDVVIISAEWGEGKRATWLTSYTIAVQDDYGNLIEIGKVSTGLKELEGEEGTTFAQMTSLLQPLIISEKGKIVEVKPQIVIEVNYEEIQKSPTYSSGYALRFPRFIRLREDRSGEEISDINFVEDLYYEQKGKGNK